MSASQLQKPVTIRQRRDPRTQQAGLPVAPIKVESEARAGAGNGETLDGHLWSLETGSSTTRADGTTAGEYKVGYGKPPLATRFTSENQPQRRGRKPKPKSTREAELALMNASYPSVEKGKPITLNGHQLMARARFQKALEGDLRAMAEIIRSTMPTPDELDEIEKGRPLTEHELNVWKTMIEIARGPEADNGN
ncbi:hypothetical protein [Sphingobium subterraneum]|uniref:Uncharacterized protein n=1 Tax=Sphingobium subterraneum TaxID=627688 RepID=A0A841J8U9_9SPHN|nr:hypothetical protein [Sphingobium subterraneum]MBB6124591.1 hypothetical protein [Sphingobium subterraneum]